MIWDWSPSYSDMAARGEKWRTVAIKGMKGFKKRELGSFPRPKVDVM